MLGVLVLDELGSDDAQLDVHKLSTDPADGWGQRTPAAPPIRDRPRSSAHAGCGSTGAVSV